ncbi:MAG: hypothetical protein H5T36_00215 [Methanobacteriaceae archaeon]|nr:hypothetical protein [Methanobacteriaceae archaeon]
MIHDYYLSKLNCKKVEKRNDIIKELAVEKRNIIKELAKEHKTNTEVFYPSPANLNRLPRGSFLIKISFTLKKPYTSKDDGEFRIVNKKMTENPIVRDTFTGLPIVRSSTWKGHLKFAAGKVKWEENEKRKIIKRLFGPEPTEDEALKGRLYFFSTFFKDKAEEYVITPLKRDTRIPAKGPISLEVMKPGRKGDFYLLYVPYPRSENFKDEIKEDLKFIAEALKLMFYTYGFSAKKTSGFGVVKRQLNEGKIWTRTNEFQSFSNLHELSEKLLKTLDGMKDERH